MIRILILVLAKSLRAYIVPAKDLSLVPRTHIRQHIATCNYSFRVLKLLLNSISFNSQAGARPRGWRGRVGRADGGGSRRALPGRAGGPQRGGRGGGGRAGGHI